MYLYSNLHGTYEKEILPKEISGLGQNNIIGENVNVLKANLMQNIILV